MSAYTFRLAHPDDKPALLEFLNSHWGSKHPLVNLPDYFEYYYMNSNPAADPLNFALCLDGEKIAAVCGFIPADKDGTDVWISIWCADKKEKGSGLELMDSMPALTGAKRMSCNNIRPNTIPFYEFLGYTGARMDHYYRLAAGREYKVARVESPEILPVQGGGELKCFESFDALKACFTPDASAVPYKDEWYLQRRYFAYPRQEYLVYGGFVGDACPLLFCLRRVEVSGSAVLRIADIQGDYSKLPLFGEAIDRLMRETGAEYIDCYCFGMEPELMAQSGFIARPEETADIIPHYLTPPLWKNIEYYMFTSTTENFKMFRADGDQDRPNISVE